MVSVKVWDRDGINHRRNLHSLNNIKRRITKYGDNMKINKNLKTALVTVALVTTSFVVGKQQGEQNILDRWENRWFESKWYDLQSIEDIIYDKDYSIELGE
tara:strand:- start:81 stop:383 length:303 start_codon:yes stop_codon:yes gene_type:complete